MSRINLLYVNLCLLAMTQFGVAQSDGGCPDAYPDTGQTDVPPVGWNGVNVIGGSTLSYCQTRTRCSVTCTATSIFSPMFSVNNGDCYPVTTLSKQFTFTRNHPNFLITFNCPFVKSFRCVYNVSSYSPKYILEESTVDNCGETPPTPTETTTSSPGTTVPSTTTGPDTTTEVAVGIPAVVVAVVIVVLVVVVCVICIRKQRRKRRNDTSSSSPHNLVHVTTTVIPGTPDTSSVTTHAAGNETPQHSHMDTSSNDGFSAGGDQDDTSSSVSDGPGGKLSEARGNGDGGEEVDAPYPILLDNGAGVSQMVTGCNYAPMVQKVAHSAGSQLPDPQVVAVV